MKILVQILFLSCFLPSFSVAQFSDNFSDGDFTNNPTWVGDVDSFRVNEINELQLDASTSGTSALSLAYDLSVDFTWAMDIEMDFAPSGSNQLQVYFLLDNIDVSIANGYFIEVGESLAEDAINIYRLDSGSKVLLASGEAGAMGQKPAIVSLQLDRVEGLWTLSTDYSKQNVPIEELNFFDDTYDFIQQGFFTIQTKYTNSNITNFFFDNIRAEAFQPDIVGPEFINGEVVSSNSVLLRFNEEISENSVQNLDVTITPDNALVSANRMGIANNSLLLVFTDDFQSGVDYNMNFQGLQDAEGNVMLASSYTFQLSLSPSVGDLVVNEILFDPETGGSDFIEILNISDKLLNLEGLVILNVLKVDSDEIVDEAILLAPGGIVAFSVDTSEVITMYEPPSTARLHEMKIPSLNVSEGNVTLVDTMGQIIDAFNYFEFYHLDLLDETKGVSLERIFPESMSVESNFTSGVESTNFATPGYKNANFRTMGNASSGNLVIENPVLSPNGDGNEDQLIMVLNMPSSGFVSTIKVFNIGGQVIKTISNNRLTGLQDIVVWDGTMDDGGKAPIGHYIVTMEAFTENGDTVKGKKHVKVLDFF